MNAVIQIEAGIAHLARLGALGKKLFIFGLNGFTAVMLRALRNVGHDAAAILDNNPVKQGSEVLGVRVCSPESAAIPFDGDAKFLIASRHHEVMAAQLESMGYPRSEHVMSLLDEDSLDGPDFLSERFIESRIMSARHGLGFYKKLCQSFGDDLVVFLAPVSSVGDIFLLGLYFSKFIVRMNLEKYLLLVPGAPGAGIAKSYGIRNVVTITREDAADLMACRMLLGRDAVDVRILHSGYLHQRIVCNIIMHRNMTWLENYRRFLFGFNENEPFQRRKVNTNPQAAKRLLEGRGLAPGKTAVLSPYAQTMAPLPDTFWTALAKELRQSGYSVCTNVAGTEREIEGTVPLRFELDDAEAVLEQAGCFIGLRSGLCDIISMADCKKVILFTREIFECIKVIDFYSLNKMGLCHDAIELEMSDDHGRDIATIMNALEGNGLPMVSVIIPVYNVAPYLDRCLETVVNQTYRDIEILLINDGSTDGSGTICRRWAASDSRIVYHEKENEGLGPTRNYGLSRAKGEYILFVDSDDWLELNAVEKLMLCANEHRADIVFMNFYYSEFTEQGRLTEQPYIRSYSISGAHCGRDMPDVIFDGDARMWSKLFRKSLFIDNDLYLPAHPYEDFPIMPLLVIYAERICQIDDVLYHYFFSRPGNLIGNPENKKHIFTGLRELHDAFRSRGLLEKYEKPLREYIINLAKFALNNLTGDRDEHIRSIVRIYPDYPYNMTQKVIVWGSYNSLCVARGVFLLNSQIVNHYMFSSIVSAMSSGGSNVWLRRHENKFRQGMIDKDVNKVFLRTGQNELPGADYIFVDFLEEISDIAEFAGSYYTNSEAHRDIRLFAGCPDLIPIVSAVRRRLWREKCLDFIARLKESISADKVILLRMQVCTRYGLRPDSVMEFANADELCRINAELDAYYDFFEAHFPGVKSVAVEDDALSFTYERTVYGCLPQYYNGMKYRQIAGLISDTLQGKG